VRFDDISESGIEGRGAGRAFPTAPTREAHISFEWSGDTAAQGWGIVPRAAGANLPDHVGQPARTSSSIPGSHHADCRWNVELKLPNGEIWRNIITEQNPWWRTASKQFRANYKYSSARTTICASNARCRCSRNGVRGNQRMGPLGTRDETRLCADGSSLLVERGARRAFMNSCRCELCRQRRALSQDRRMGPSSTSSCRQCAS